MGTVQRKKRKEKKSFERQVGLATGSNATLRNLTIRKQSKGNHRKHARIAFDLHFFFFKKERKR